MGDSGTGFLMQAVQKAESALPSLLQTQVTDPADQNCGAVYHGDAGVPYLPIHLLQATIPLYACPQSKYHQDQNLGSHIQLAALACLRMQDAGGTISMFDCNFHSPPDTAFAICALAPALALARQTPTPGLAERVAPLEEFLQQTGPAMLTGGIHTPNHRWVMVAALAWLYHLSGRDEFVTRADEWLAEGMDITEDGEWTERSLGVYSQILASAFITAALLLHRPALLDPVRRTLKRMVFFTHPGGELVTEISHRQDRGQPRSIALYYRPYRFLAAIDGDATFAAMADWARRLGGTCSLLEELLYPELTANDVARAVLPQRYTRKFGEDYAYPDLPRVFHYDKPRHRYTPKAPVVRERRDDVSLTILGEHPHFLSLRAGQARLIGVRVVPAYFGCGPIRFPAIAAENGRWILEKVHSAWYNGPLPAEHGVASGVWGDMDHSRRPLDHHGSLRVRCEVAIHDDGFDLHVACNGHERVLLQVAFLFDLAGQFDPAPGLLEVGPDDYLLVEGSACFRQGDNCLQVSTDAAQPGHRMPVLRGDEPRRGTLNLLVNSVAPVQQTYSVALRRR